MLLVEGRGPGVSREGRPYRRSRVEESGLGGPKWDPEVFGDLGNCHPEGVVEDEDGALLRRQTSEAAVQLVSVMDCPVLVTRNWFVRLEQDDVRSKSPATPGLGVARIDEDPVEPCLEPIEVTEGGQFTPRLNERDLYSVLGEVGITQDPMRDEDAAVADRPNQGAEGLLVTLSRSLDESPEHPLPPGVGAWLAPSTSMMGSGLAIVRSTAG
jgi:hypothetical protein